MKRVYVYPKFSTLGAFGFRRGGPGLGNLFFPYARALLLAKKYGYTLINPSWPTFKLGTFLRREQEKRMYLKVFNRYGISGARKTFLLLASRKISESEADDNIPPGSLVLTEGLGNFFRDIAHEREYISECFRNILKMEDAGRVRAMGSLGIGVHVRLGDFEPHQRIPISWYARTIEKIRRATGVKIPVTVASDGTDAELAELLHLPGVRRLRLGPVGELFALAQSKIILASNSTFSAWAAFLGHVPVLWARRDESLRGIFTDGTPDEVLAEEDNLSSRMGEYLRRTFR